MVNKLISGNVSPWQTVCLRQPLYQTALRVDDYTIHIVTSHDAYSNEYYTKIARRVNHEDLYAAVFKHSHQNCIH